MRLTCFVGLVLLSAVAHGWAPSSASASLSKRVLGNSNLRQMTLTRAIAVPAPSSSSQTMPSGLAEQDQWIANLDYEGFGKEVAELGKLLLAEGGQDDVDHLNKMVLWRNAAAVIGVCTMWMAPVNPISIVALSTWTYSSWAMIAHHTCHGGYNRVNSVDSQFNSRGFALGSIYNRAKDWLDWMHPEAWNVEHNRLHHYRLNERADPDLVQKNLDFLRRDPKMPKAAKYAVVAFFLPLWKWFYYAPNTYKELAVSRWLKQGKELPAGFKRDHSITVLSMLNPRNKSEKALLEMVPLSEFVQKCIAPFFLGRFVLLPAPLLLVPGVGPTLFTNAVINLILAELLTNVHGFITIVTNHAGNDMYTFSDAVKPKTPSFYVRQIVGSTNYELGKDWIDFGHGFLNYQIEHHVWPDLSMRQYQKAAPQLKAICEKYGVPYRQESVWTRLQKTVDIMIGNSSMRKFPVEYEPARDKAGEKGVTWKSTNGAIDDE